MTIELKDITWRQPWPIKHMEQGGGLMPHTAEAAALWQFLICAVTAIKKIPTQTTLIGREDETANLMQLAHSSKNIFELTTLEGMFNAKLIDLARREAKRTLLPWPIELDYFFISGGKNQSQLDRDPDKVFQG